MHVSPPPATPKIRIVQNFQKSKKRSKRKKKKKFPGSKSLRTGSFYTQDPIQSLHPSCPVFLGEVIKSPPELRMLLRVYTVQRGVRLQCLSPARSWRWKSLGAAAVAAAAAGGGGAGAAAATATTTSPASQPLAAASVRVWRSCALFAGCSLISVCCSARLPLSLTLSLSARQSRGNQQATHG